MLVLLGVSSAQINASPKDIVSMGAHENSFLVPRMRFLQMAADTNPAIGEWMKRKLANEPDSQEVKHWKQSLSYGTIVCEGTGILHPVAAREKTERVRKFLERYMSEPVFFALRREYFFNKKSGFLKTVEKIFVAEPLFDDPLGYTSFLVMQEHSEKRGAPMQQSLTKSVSFNAFMRASARDESSGETEPVRTLMEHLMSRAEWLACFEAAKNIHPPADMDAPHQDSAAEVLRCKSVINTTLKDRVIVTGSQGAPTTKMVYYLRRSKIDVVMCSSIYTFLSHEVPSGVVRGWKVYPEWATDEVGGYRIEVEVDEARMEEVINREGANEDATDD
jgi:hypothetical protein